MDEKQLKEAYEQGRSDGFDDGWQAAIRATKAGKDLAEKQRREAVMALQNESGCLNGTCGD